MIDWTGMQHYLKSLPFIKRLSILQMIHNWHNTGQQNELFAKNDTAYKNIQDLKLQNLANDHIKQISNCPFQCGGKETHVHFLECKAPQVEVARRKLIKDFKSTCQKQNIHESIIHLILWGLQWINNKQVPTCHLLDGSLNREIQAAIQEQTEIGWNKMRQGFLSSRWAKAQHIYTNDHNQTTRNNWSRIITSKVLEPSWTMWNEQNTALHETNQKDLRENIYNN